MTSFATSILIAASLLTGFGRTTFAASPVVQQAYLKASNTDPGDGFGAALAMDGDTLVVGAPVEGSKATEVNGNQSDNSATGAGAVYVFVKKNGGWEQEAYLKCPNTGESAFGAKVAISGDAIVVSGSGPLTNPRDSASYSGSAYVFVRSNGTWTFQAALKASNAENQDGFGRSVAISSDTIAIGAAQEKSNATGINGNQSDNSAPNAGAVYVFTRSGRTWSQEAYVKASNTHVGDSYASTGDFFGASVSLSGETMLVGAYGEQGRASGINGNQALTGATNSGAAYVFQRTDGVWAQQAYLKASNADAGDYFGYSLAISGDTAIVGADGERSVTPGVQTNNSGMFSGAAYIFVRSGGSWTQQAYLKASNLRAGAHFGSSVALSGDHAIVGSSLESSNATGIDGDQTDTTAGNSGAAYFFSRSAGSWKQEAYIKASNTEANDTFGLVALSMDTAAISSLDDSNATGVNGDPFDNSATTAGAVFAYSIAPTPISSSIPPPALSLPKVTLLGKKSIRTTKPKITIAGTASGNVEAITYQIGKITRSVIGTKAWSFSAKLKKGKNLFTVTAHGSTGDSIPVKITITRS